MKISNELKIGFWAIVALVALFLGANYLKGVHTLQQGQIFYFTTDKVNGLAVSSHVKLHGLKVGTVRSMDYEKENDRISVVLNIYDNDLLIPVDSRLYIMPDLLGTSDVVLEMGQSQQHFNNWDTIHACPSQESLLDKADPVVNQITELMPKIDSLISGINVLVNESKLHESLLQINTMTQHLNTTVQELNHLLRKDVPALMSGVENTVADFDSVAVQLREAHLAELLQHTSQTMASANKLLTQMQSEDSTTGRLISTTELHDQLSRTIADMDSLINDVKQNPKKYINVKVF